MFTAFSTALSALRAAALGIDVVGNNLANLNTTGFKASTVCFHDLVTQSLGSGTGATQIGFGVAAPSTLRQFSQGAIQSTSGPLDAAIQGDGFFIVRDRSGNLLYTRGGSFQVDKDGTLLTSTGDKVQGWTSLTGGAVDTNQPLGNITIPTGTLTPPKQTGNISFDLNLNAAAAEGDTFSSPIQIYDSLGASHVLTATFTKDAATGQWNYSITIPGADVGDTTAATHEVANGSITFDDTLVPPVLATPAATDGPIAFDVTGFADHAADITGLKWQLYNGTTPRLTQYAQPSATSTNWQDGSASAQLASISLADGGQVLARYSDGQQMVVGQLALASIRNPESLIAVGNNNYQLSANSALPADGLPASGGRGQVMGGAVENSNVDIAREFTNLIVLQRAYEANSKVVTASDELSQDTINLKR